MSVKRIKVRTKAKKAVASNWLATGTLAAYVTLGSAQPAKAQQVAASGVAGNQANTLSVVQLQIAAGPLIDVAKAFEIATGRRVIFENEQLLDIGSQGVSGPLTFEAAIRQMLLDTGVSYRLEGNSVVLELRSLFRVDVTEEVPQITSARYTSTLRDIPQTISIIPRSVIEQQGATTLAQVLRNVPGLTMTAGEGGVAAGDNLTLRGNSARNDIFIDGSRDISSQSRDPFNMEQVEVTKGPTSAVMGRGSAGGTVNLISKVPNGMRGIGGSFAFGNAAQRRSTFDINTPARFLGDRTGFRLNLLWHESGVPGRQVVQNDRWGFAPALTFGLGSKTRLTLQHYKLKQDNTSDYGIPWVPATNNALIDYRDKPAPVPRDTFYGFASRDREFLNQDSSTVRVDHEFTDGLSIRNQLRYGRAGRNSIVSPPRFASVDSTVINRGLTSWVAQDRIWDNQTDLRANFKTFGVDHNAVIGTAFTRENNLRVLRSGVVSTTTLLNPDPYATYTGPITTGNRGDITGRSQALYAFDTVHLGPKLDATGGVRWERFDVNGINTALVPVQQTVKMSSVRAGLVYKPLRGGSIYGSYGSSLTPSLDGLSYSTSSTAIPPEKTYTTEFGAKWDLIGGRMLASGAVFRVAKDNARTPGLLPTDPPQVLAGQQVSKGVELSVTGAVTRSLRVLGAYTLIDAKINSSNTPAEVGKYFQNTPRHSASVWATYTKQRFSFGVGPRWMSKRYGNNSNTRSVDGYWTMDAMGSYAVNDHLDLRLNLTNLNNAFYFDRLGGGHLIPAQSRGVLMTTNFRF